MLSVELTNLADILDATGQLRNVSQQAKTWSSRIHDAILKTTVRNVDFRSKPVLIEFSRSWTISMPMKPTVRPNHHYDFPIVHPFSGFGGRYVMDDANVPVSKLLPLLFYVSDHVLALTSHYCLSLILASSTKMMLRMLRLANYCFRIATPTMPRGRNLTVLGMYTLFGHLIFH